MTFRAGTLLLAAAAACSALTPAYPADRDTKPTAPAARSEIEPPPNVLFIIADDLAPRLGSYGAPVKTPSLDALARSGVQFDQAYAQFPWCAPSRASFLTGTRPDTTRVTDLTTPFRSVLPNIQTLPQYFRNHGYFTARVGKVFHQGVPGDIGTSGPDDTPSWDQVSNPRGRDRDAEAGRLKNNTPGIPYGSAMAWLDDEGADAEQTDGKVAISAINLLRAGAAGTKPFFLAVGFYRPHVPLVAPQAYFAPYSLARIAIANETPASLARVPQYTKDWLPDNFGMSPDQQREVIRAYSASTSFMDAQVGLVLDELKRLGLERNTIVVFVSDHGFLLGEHGQWMKNLLWNESTRVPMIIRAPGIGPGRSGRTVELLDLYPTLTQLAGLPHYDRNEGTSLVRLLHRPASAWNRPAFSQVRGGRSLRTERWRYTEWEDGRLGVELYDHRADPGERRNLASDRRYAQVVARFREMLPRGPAERRPAPLQYDPVKQCLSGFPATPSATATGTTPARKAGEDGLVRCQRLDP